MAEYEFLHAHITGYSGRGYECLLKKESGSDQPFHKMPAIHAQTGERVVIFPQDEVRIFGNEPMSAHLVKWWQEAIIERQRRQLKEAKDFFGTKPFLAERIKSFFRFFIP